MLDERLDAPGWSMRLAYGVVSIVAGLDKMTGVREATSVTRPTQRTSPPLQPSGVGV